MHTPDRRGVSNTVRNQMNLFRQNSRVDSFCTVASFQRVQTVLRTPNSLEKRLVYSPWFLKPRSLSKVVNNTASESSIWVCFCLSIASDNRSTSSFVTLSSSCSAADCCFSSMSSLNLSISALRGSDCDSGVFVVLFQTGSKTLHASRIGCLCALLLFFGAPIFACKRLKSSSCLSHCSKS